MSTSPADHAMRGEKEGAGYNGVQPKVFTSGKIHSKQKKRSLNSQNAKSYQIFCGIKDKNRTS